MATARPPRGGAGAPKSVDAYLARLPDRDRAALMRLRAQIRAAAPEATEKISYGMPTFAHAGTNLVHMAAFRDHLSFFPGRDGVTTLLASALEGFPTAKGTIRFTAEKPLPAALVKKIVKLRVAESEARAASRRAKGAKKAKGAKGARVGSSRARR